LYYTAARDGSCDFSDCDEWWCGGGVGGVCVCREKRVKDANQQR